MMKMMKMMIVLQALPVTAGARVQLLCPAGRPVCPHVPLHRRYGCTVRRARCFLGYHCRSLTFSLTFWLMFWCSSGRYNKFCRSLPQTPWLIGGERRMESSVEELIAAPVLTTFRANGESWRLVPAGADQTGPDWIRSDRTGPDRIRSDQTGQDRTLTPARLLQVSTSPRLAGRTWTCGRWETVRLFPHFLRLSSGSELPAPPFSAGRPFAMELLNPHRSRVSRAEMKQLQEVRAPPPGTRSSAGSGAHASCCFQTINASSDKIRVRDLQTVTR